MARKAKVDSVIIALAGIAAMISFLVSLISAMVSSIGAFIVSFKIPIIVFATIFVSTPLIYLIYQSLYFKSKEFRELKNSISEYINNCNELNHHILELKAAHANIKSFDYGLGSMKDGSKFNFKRAQWSIETKNRFVHNCSATICKNAHNQPLKYLCKYFDLEITEASLSNMESVLNDFAAAEQGKYLLKSERDSILNKIEASIPWVINAFGKARLIKELGFEDIDLGDVYFPVYSFQYISPGGNSTMSCDIRLDIENLDKLVSYMKGSINFLKSIAGQRALMNSSLREKIKTRDNFTCQICGLSTRHEKNLLLEIDHITPLSKGGITSETNLQTLCWKCNRSKGSKISVEKAQVVQASV